MAQIIQVNPLSVIIQYFKSQPLIIDPEYFNGQVAIVHKFGNGWQHPRGLTIKEEPTQADIYTNTFKQRLEARVWADNHTQCEIGYRVVVSYLNVNKVRVGNALLRSLVQTITPFIGDDSVTSKSYWMFFLEAQVSTLQIQE